MNVKRDLAGGMGVADPSARRRFGHDPDYITMPNLSLLHTAGVLDRDGHSVTFLDAQAEDLDKEPLVERVRRIAPELIVELMNLPSLYGDLEILKTLRERIPGVRTAAVGVPTIPLLEIISKSGAADAIVRGDPELMLPLLVQTLSGQAQDNSFERVGDVLINWNVRHLHDLDALPPIPYHLVPLEKYWYYPFGVGVPYASFFASRGCSYHCYYCPYPMGFGKNIIHRDPVKLVDEIEALYHNRGVRAILFRDQVFTMDRAKTLQLCDEIIRRGLKISWLAETRLDKVDQALIQRMKESGCVRLQFGIESGDPGLFEREGKDDAKGKLEEFLTNFQMVERSGIAAHMFILVGLLGETWATVRNSIGIVRRIKPITLQVAVVTPYPGTGLFDMAKRKGLIKTEDFAQYSGFIPVIRTEKMSSEELLQARHMIIKAHRRTVYWKKKRHHAGLAVRYALDGSLWTRLNRMYQRRPVPSFAIPE
jgi:radical SAM superfamily enzyme YgiQ (UPF0313 family)